MGPVAAICTLAIFAGCAYFGARAWAANAERDPIGTWVARIVMTLFVVLSGVSLIDAYIVDVQMPFAPRGADLPARSDPPEHTPDLVLPADTEPVKPTASADHRAGLREWEAAAKRDPEP